jgi:hypothetical protein
MSYLNSYKQDTLVSGTNIKTINGSSILGSGNLVVTGSGATWGSITGTLSSQTDLNTALAGKVPTTRTLTINGSTQDLSADRTFTINPVSGTVVLLTADETIYSGGTNATAKTYTLSSNTYSRIIIEGECEFQQNVNLNSTTNFVIYVGSTSKRTVECVASATGAGDYMRDGISIKYSEAITAGATIQIRTENVTNASYQVNSMRVYGVY